jgi:TRAP-type C4-dicarboxylate transport system substrate-binding protein
LALRLAMALALVSGIGVASRAEAAETITLKAVTPFNPEMYLSKPLFIFKDLVEKETNGRIQIKILGAEEAVPSQQQFDALRNGVLDVIVGVTSYYAGQVPEGMALLYTRQQPSEQRSSGLYDALRKAHLDKAGVIYLANAGGTPGTGFRLYLRTKIDKPDLSGLKLRVSPVYTALVQALGGTPVSIPFADAYSSLERGVVDGFGSTYAGITDYGLNEVSKYVVNPPFYSVNEAILFNKDTWDAMPEDLRNQLESIGVEFEKAVEQYMTDYITSEDELLKSKGMEFITFTGDDAKKYLDLAYAEGWKAFLEKTPDSGAEIKALAEK